MPLGSADLHDDGERIARIEERLKRVDVLESAVERLWGDIRALERKQVRSDIANALVFGMAVLVLAGFFGVVVAYFQGRPIGAPVSMRSSEGAMR